MNDTLYIYNSQNTMNILSVIKNNNTGGGATDTLHLLVGGAGTTTVHAANTYTGGTTIAAGTLAIGNNSAAANDAGLGTGDIVNHGTLVLSKTIGATAAQMTLANNISGSGAFTINRGVATLTGTNTYQGDTNVSAATSLVVGSATALSADSRMLLNAATATLALEALGKLQAPLAEVRRTLTAIGSARQAEGEVQRRPAQERNSSLTTPLGPPARPNQPRHGCFPA